MTTTLPTDLPLEFTHGTSRPTRCGGLCQLVLWDLRGALANWKDIECAGHAAAFTALFGRGPRHIVWQADRADPLVALDMLVANGVPAQAAPAWLARYLPAYARSLKELAKGRAATMPPPHGLAEELRQLSDQPGLVQSFISGEIRPSIRLKLELTGLARHLDPDLGGCGSDHVDHRALPEIVRQRAQARLATVVADRDVVLLSP